ncbi:MAG: alpha/beta hydrolase [Pseudomonadota bacterium]
MQTIQRQFVNGRYGQMHVRVSQAQKTQDRPLVCLHMFPQSSRSLSAFIAEMATDRMVIAPDFPGYGESDKPTSPIAASDYAASIWDVVDALELHAHDRTIDLFGIHAGAKLAAEFARQRPEAINRIALSSAAVLTEEEVSHIRTSLASIPLDVSGTRFQSIWNMLLRNRGNGVTLEMLATTLSEILRGGEQYDWGSRAVFDYNAEFANTLSTLTHPVCLMNPGDDLYAMTPRSMAFLQNGHLCDRPQWGQGFLETKPDEVAAYVRGFLSAH